jgi:hypothetical protein
MDVGTAQAVDVRHSHYTHSLASARSALRAGDHEAVLQHASALFRAFATPPFPLPVAGGIPELDLLLDTLGAKLGAMFDLPATRAHSGNWVLATCLYETGGHTPVIRDLASALPDGLSGLVLTLAGHDLSQLTPAAVARTGLAEDAVHHAGAPTLAGTCENVLRFFDERPPKRLFLFHHPDDAAAIAAASALASRGADVWLVHHVDVCPCVGLFLPRVRLIDLTPRACAFTRHVLGLDTIFLPLTCPDPGSAQTILPRRDGLTTALAGSAFKASQDSAHDYPAVIAAMLHAGGGTHVHIGPLGDDQREAIAKTLHAGNIDRSRFVHVPVAPTLLKALRDERIDLLINTWPLGGARTAVEAMAAGVPVVWHSPHPSDDRLRLQMAWHGAPVWRHLSDLTAIVSSADATWLAAQAGAARRHYEARHHPSHWRQFFLAPDASSGLPMPEGYDASLFLPVLWSSVLDQAIEIADDRIERLQQDVTRGHDETHAELESLKERLRLAEDAIDGARDPWVVRLLHRRRTART